MSITTTQGIPPIITAGDAISFTVDDSQYPAGTWTSILIFKNALNAVLTFPGVQSGTSHQFDLTNANTATLSVGRNLACIVFSDSTHRETGDWQDILILADPATAQTPSYAQAQVTLLQAVLAEFNATSAMSVNFNGQSFTRGSIATYQNQLTQWRAELRQEKEQEKADRGLPVIGNRIPLSFTAK